MSKKPYSLRKSRQILNWVNGLYKSHWEDLSKQQLADLETSLASLDTALIEKNREEANTIARRLEAFANRFLPDRHWLRVLTEFPIALIVALLIAVVIRQMWFELYQIPTGSMRPTFKEQDHLIVSKTSFGINIPLKPQHLMFDPDLVERTGVVVLTAENLDVSDPDTKYFWVFDAKKRYIKRLIGKPGDTLYFYGGKIYGIDADGNDLPELREAEWMAPLEHIPFSTFDGRIGSMPDPQDPSTIHFLFNHMNRPLGKLTWAKNGKIEGEVLANDHWVGEKPMLAGKDHKEIRTYTDFWGMHNFAMVRLLTRDQVAQATPHDPEKFNEAPLYLELFHTPGLTYPLPKMRSNNQGNIFKILSPFSTLIPLSEAHLDRLMDSLYTARFVVKDEKAVPYQVGGLQPRADSPRFEGVPDGTYEFYFGRAHSIGFGGTPHELPKDHPLYRRDSEWKQKLFNLGIEMSLRVAPQSQDQPFLPSRYAYFRDGALYVMGAPLMEKDDPALTAFIEREKTREAEASGFKPYLPFIDRGAPMKNGVIDVDVIRRFGLKIPEKNYFVLGDNHAMSADSRYFGFVPEDNLRGTPTTLIWPWDARLGPPPQVNYPFITLPRLTIWFIALCAVGGWYGYQNRRQRQGTYVKVSVTD